jgi:hypothetical protein
MSCIAITWWFYTCGGLLFDVERSPVTLTAKEEVSMMSGDDQNPVYARSPSGPLGVGCSRRCRVRLPAFSGDAYCFGALKRGPLQERLCCSCSGSSLTDLSCRGGRRLDAMAAQVTALLLPSLS